MKIIKDIRIYRNADKRSLENKKMNLTAQRVAMKLREKGFSLGEYDHLYICFLPESPAGSVVLNDEADRYFPWFRYVYVGITPEELSEIETTQEPTPLLIQIEHVLLNMFGGDPSVETIIKEAVKEAEKGPEMMMHFKEKKAAKGTATIYLRLLDNAYYLPVLSVTNTAGTEVLRVNLPETIDLKELGEIQLSSKKVTVKPRKNFFARDLSPISFDLGTFLS